MPLTQKQMQTRYDYAKKNLKRIPLDVRKEKYEDIKAAADSAGESVNCYIKKAIDERMERDGFAPAAQATPGMDGSPAPDVSQSATKQIPSTENIPQTEHRQTTDPKPPLLPPDAEDKVDLNRLLTDFSYQFTVRDAFGEDGLARLLDKARQAE